MPNTKAVLIVGGSGFLGTHLALRLREGYKVFATYFSRPITIPGVTMIPFNLGNRNWAKRVAYTARPETIIYVAGANNVEWAEKETRDAERAHTSGAATICAVADLLQPRFIYVSNCYAFDGHRGNYRETDVVLPSTALGKFKLGGENFIRGKSLNHVIVRLSALYGRGNGRQLTFLDSLRMALDRGARVEAPVTEYHSFAPVTAAADFLARLVDGGPKNKTLHYGGLTKVTYFELAREFAKTFGYDPALILPAAGNQKRERLGLETQTLDYSLNSTLAAETLKIKPLLLEEGFDLLKQQLVPRL